jgi:hypothetical protein
MRTAYLLASKTLNITTDTWITRPLAVFHTLSAAYKRLEHGSLAVALSAGLREPYSAEELQEDGARKGYRCFPTADSWNWRGYHVVEIEMGDECAETVNVANKEEEE